MRQAPRVPYRFPCRLQLALLYSKLPRRQRSEVAVAEGWMGTVGQGQTSLCQQARKHATSHRTTFPARRSLAGRYAE
jgi:hypothetical protein